MDRRIVRRGLAVLTLALGLVLGGAQPAAAEEPGFWDLTLDRLLKIWGAEENGSQGLWEIIGGWFAEKNVAISDDSSLDRGAGLDPNGLRITVAPSDPVSPNG